MKRLFLTLLATLTLAAMVTGCRTYRGAGEDVGNGDAQIRANVPAVPATP